MWGIGHSTPPTISSGHFAWSKNAKLFNRTVPIYVKPYVDEAHPLTITGELIGLIPGYDYTKNPAKLDPWL